MPRRHLARQRRQSAARRRIYGPAHAKDGRLSGSAHAAIALLESWPGQIHGALLNWEREARRRNPWSRNSYGCGIRECCGLPIDDRDLLELTIHRLPRRSARELRVLVRSIDERIMAKSPVKFDHQQHWWHADFPWIYD
ncbi:hypothetical protein GCM10028784_00740 [Myceligenerans cantabricum]